VDHLLSRRPLLAYLLPQLGQLGSSQAAAGCSFLAPHLLALGSPVGLHCIAQLVAPRVADPQKSPGLGRGRN
jgi:hypothetical protein